jgi:hypothetical protein
MKQVLLTINLLFYITLLLAQPNFSKAYRVHDNEDFLCGFGSLTVTDSAYYISGGTNDTLYGYSINRGMLMKIDTNGNKVWVEVYGDTLKTALTSSNSMIVTNQGYLARVGRHRDWTGCLLLTDFDGNVIFNKSYYSGSPDTTMYINKVVQDNNSNFYLLGNLYHSYDGYGLLIKTDSLGNELWRTTYSNPPYNRLLSSDIVSIGNNEYIITYNVTENEYHEFSYRDGTWIFKIDSLGNILDEYKTPYSRWVSGYNTTVTKNKGILFCHTEALSVPGTSATIPTYDNGGYIGKLDSNLQLVWEKRYGHTWSQFAYVKEKDNGEILLTGNSYNDLLIDSFGLTGWIMALDENGDSLWQREYGLFSGIRQYHLLKDFEILDDGRLVISGWINNTNSYANVGTAQGYWGWLLRTDSFGCIVPGCQLLDNTEDVAVLFDNDVTVFPNPASEVVNFQFEKPINEKVVIRVYSGLGQLVGEVGQGHALALQDTMQIEVSDWHSGMYFYGVYVEGQLVKQGQLLIRN